MVVICPKCRVKLKIDDAKIGPQGTRFKCPKCSAVLIVRNPAAKPKTGQAPKTLIVAHANPVMRDKIASLLKSGGFSVLTAADGVEVMVRALRERPSVGIIEVALPKIYGFEVCKRLKSREETKGMKFILMPSIHDRSRYRREPVSLYGADEYVEEHEIETSLISTINRLCGKGPEEKPGEKTGSGTIEMTSQKMVSDPEAPMPFQEPVQKEPPIQRAIEKEDRVKYQAAPAEIKEPSEVKSPAEPETDERIEKAKRLARTIINDIYLYNSAKVDSSLRNDNFYAVFANEIREGQKLYDNRIPQEIRNIHNYYKEAIENFLSARKIQLK